jgi:hypothetical protein
MKFTARQIQASSEFRANLWKEFVANYQAMIAAGPEAFSKYCEAFRQRWVRWRLTLFRYERTAARAVDWIPASGPVLVFCPINNWY